jgi:cobalt/nickel transport system permease protein
MTGPAHSATHQHLYWPGGSRVHRAAPEAKLLGTFGFVVVVAVTPRHAVWVAVVQAAVLLVVVASVRLPVRLVVARLVVVVPFLLAALLVPFVAGGEQVQVAGWSVSEAGLWSTWNIVSKAVLGASASIVLASTTTIADVLRGLTRLRVPTVFVAILAFMMRYLDLLVDRLRRMRAAMSARGHDPRWLWQVRPIAASAGTLFVRTYEQGERVHQAMLARGFDGSMPALDVARADAADWSRCLLPAAVAATALGTWWVW